MFQDLAAINPTSAADPVANWQGKVMRCQAVSGVEVGGA